MPKKILTQEDLDQNPSLVELGVKVGDEIDVPGDSEKAVSSEENLEDENDDDTGGSNPPPNKERGG